MVHERFLRQALHLATLRRGFCSPNPSVGAIVVKNKSIIGEGVHFAPGFVHAEVAALHSALGRTQGATVYVTLEPCAHTGRTPPCVQALINAGVSKVIYGAKDPNESVSGRGEEVLNASGIHCEHYPLPEIDQFYAAYYHWCQHKMPYITAKLAISADGLIAGEEGTPVQITGAACARLTHQHRLRSDALLTTAQTVLKDDPALNARLNHQAIAKPVYILDRTLKTPLTSRLFLTADKLTFFHAKSANPAHVAALSAMSKVTCCVVPDDNEQLDLCSVFKAIADSGAHDVWVEAGSCLFNSLIDGRLLSRAFLYQSPNTLNIKGIHADQVLMSLKKSASSYRHFLCGEDQVLDSLFS